MRNIFNMLFLVLLIACCAFASEETQGLINADTLQGLTSSAFMTTNDFESLKVTIEKLKSSAEACADGIVDLQLGLSTLSHEERIVREKDLNKIIEDYSKISSELVSISSAENQGNRTGETYALQSDLEELASELLSLQNYVRTYLGHLKAEEETWYFTIDGALLGTNATMSANSSSISSTVLIGQTFQVKNISNIRKIKIKAELSAPPYNCVFLSPYSPTITTNTFVYADSRINEGNNIYSYSFSDYPVSTNSIYIFGVRGRNSYSQICLNKCSDAYTGATNCLWTGTGSRYSLDALSEFDLTAQPNYDLCFDISFTSITNLIVSKDGIEIKNDASLKIDGQDVATVPEINSRIAENCQSIYHSLSNHVFGTTSIANGSVTAEKLASNAVTEEKILNNAIGTTKIADGAITENKLSTNAVTSAKINSNAITTGKIEDGAVTGSKLSSGAVNTAHIIDGAITSGKIADSSITESKLSNSAVTTSKINDNAVTAAKIGNGAISGNKIQSNAISSSHITAQAITEEKIATNSVQLFHFTETLKSNIVLSSGGVVTGKLEVTDFIIRNSGNWHIGTETNRTDLIIDNQEGNIATLDGDLNLIANGNNKSIKALSFLQVNYPGQCGKIAIPAGDNYAIISETLSSNAVINITPAQDTLLRYWVDIDVSGQATINISDTCNTNLYFYYSILKK
ncbi:hypothetical protein IKZ40_08580 [bacterium]|nr:hypothetical protein [bacterium]